MKKFILIYSALILLVTSHASAAQFFETLYDIPVMEGLTELPEMALSFDKPNGRIAEAGAMVDNLSPREIVSFYKISLGQMGWQQKTAQYDPYVFVRDGEELSIFLDKSDTSLTIRFLLQPQE